MIMSPSVVNFYRNKGNTFNMWISFLWVAECRHQQHTVNHFICKIRIFQNLSSICSKLEQKQFCIFVKSNDFFVFIAGIYNLQNSKHFTIGCFQRHGKNRLRMVGIFNITLSVKRKWQIARK